MMNRATPITSALKRKYSPFKETEAEKEAKKLLVDESGKSVYAQTSIKTPGKTETKTRLSYRDAWEQDLEGVRTGGGYTDVDDYIAKREAAKALDPEGTEAAIAAATGVSGGPGTVTITTPGGEEKSQVKLKTKVEGAAQTPDTYRRQVRSGKFAAGVEKRAAVDKARAEAKKKGLKGKEKRDYIKNARTTAKEIQKQKIQDLAGEVSTNVQKTAEAGKGETGTYVKGQRDMMQSEVDDQTTLSAQTSGPGAAKKFYGGLGANLSSDLGVDTSLSGTVKEALKFSPTKFKSYGKKSPMKKLSDLSGDGKITKKDVLMGRGVINKDGSPAKYGNKKSPYKMKGYGSKRY